MPYISSDTVKTMRQELRNRFPDFKLSVTRQNGSTVDVTILSGPLDFGVDSHQVNHYYIQDHFQGEPMKFLQSVYNTVNVGVRELVYDGDYGSIPTYYTHINIGRWDRPYVVKK